MFIDTMLGCNPRSYLSGEIRDRVVPTTRRRGAASCRRSCWSKCALRRRGCSAPISGDSACNFTEEAGRPITSSVTMVSSIRRSIMPVRIDPVARSGIVILSSGSGEFATRLAADWEHWNTGTVNGLEVIDRLGQRVRIIAIGAAMIVVSQADRRSWWRQTSSSGAAPLQRSPRRRGNRFSALWNTRAHISPASVAHRDRGLAACGSGDVPQRRLPCRSGTARCLHPELQSGRNGHRADVASRSGGRIGCAF